MKTQELKKLEGMEDISNFFGNPAPPATIAAIAGQKGHEIDRKKLEIMKKLNFRSRDRQSVFRHRQSMDYLEYEMMGQSKETFNSGDHVSKGPT